MEAVFFKYKVPIFLCFQLNIEAARNDSAYLVISYSKNI